MSRLADMRIWQRFPLSAAALAGSAEQKQVYPSFGRLKISTDPKSAINR